MGYKPIEYMPQTSRHTQPAPKPIRVEQDNDFNWNYYMWLITLGTIVAMGILF